MSEPIKNRYEFVILFDVENGNPNGDPDAGNMPRVDPETGLGIVTDVCLKRKIRNYVETVKEDATGYRIYVKDGVPLNRSDAEAYAELDVTEKTVKEKKKADPDLDRKIRDWMCANFYDIRTFGAVMTTFVKAALNCGQVRGPVQLGFARSVEPVVPQEVTITRVAITTEADAEKKGTEMGRKYIVPYGLYRCEGYISANLARKTTGFCLRIFLLSPPRERRYVISPFCGAAHRPAPGRRPLPGRTPHRQNCRSRRCRCRPRGRAFPPASTWRTR